MKIMENDKNHNPPIVTRHNGPTSIAPSYEPQDIDIGNSYFN